MGELLADIVREIQESIAVQAELSRMAASSIAEAAKASIECMRAGAKVIAFGNGGSASDAQHLVAELVGRYRKERRPLAALALTSNSSSITSIANDYGFDEIFARQLKALAKAQDVVLAISTSGNSLNVLKGLESARTLGCFSVGLTGKTGGKMQGLVDVCINAPSDSTPRIQEVHALVIHILSGIIENAFVETETGNAFGAGGTLSAQRQ